MGGTSICVVAQLLMPLIHSDGLLHECFLKLIPYAWRSRCTDLIPYAIAINELGSA